MVSGAKVVCDGAATEEVVLEVGEGVPRRICRRPRRCSAMETARDPLAPAEAGETLVSTRSATRVGKAAKGPVASTQTAIGKKEENEARRNVPQIVTSAAKALVVKCWSRLAPNHVPIEWKWLQKS